MSNWNSDKNIRVSLRLSSIGEDAIFGPDQPLRLSTDMLAPYKGKVIQSGAMRLTGSGTKDNLALAALSGENDRAYLYLFNTSQTPLTGYVKVGLRSAWDTDSASGDWFSVIPSYGQMFIPISDMQSVDLEANSGNPIVEYMLLQKNID